MSILSTPNEIINHILSYTAGRRPAKDLDATSRTNHRLAACSRPIMFKRLRVDAYDFDRDHNGNSFSETINILSNHPNIANHVRELPSLDLPRSWGHPLRCS